MKPRALEIIGQGPVPRALRAALALRSGGSETGGVSVREIVDFVNDIGSQAGIKNNQLTGLVNATLYPVLSEIHPNIIKDRPTRIRLGLDPKTLANLASIDGPWSREIEKLALDIEPAPGLEDFLGELSKKTAKSFGLDLTLNTNYALGNVFREIRDNRPGKIYTRDESQYVLGNKRYKITVVGAPDPASLLSGAISYILEKRDGTAFTPHDVKLINQYSFKFRIEGKSYENLDFRFWPPVHDLEPRNFFKYPNYLQLTFPFSLEGIFFERDGAGFKELPLPVGHDSPDHDFITYTVEKLDSKI